MSIRIKAHKTLAGQLGIDLRPLGNPVPIERLNPGEFILAVNETWIASGRIREISQTGSYHSVILRIDNYSTTYVNSPALFFRVDPDTDHSTPSRIARFFGSRPAKTLLPRTITSILGTPFTPTDKISLNDERRHVVIQDDTDRTWNRQTIQTVRRERSTRVNNRITVITRNGTPPASHTETHDDLSRLHVIHPSTP